MGFWSYGRFLATISGERPPVARHPPVARLAKKSKNMIDMTSGEPCTSSSSASEGKTP
ncbi:hypothetical protein L484_025304 [Morus notabilis]|uniref:Uncharacterized protein n=1 Tax=Morus notabilis TaxID=981085 RepID=W9RUJ6_9ROSA|nr:hypothetical protein L484_025304 [Morus notabilis]